MPEIETDGSDERTQDAVVKVRAETMKETTTRWLEPGQFFEMRSDEPNVVSVNVVADDAE